MPATTDYWINDRGGDPLLLINADINASLITAFPNLLRQVRAAIGDRKVTIVFDRGGWSPKLFRRIIQEGFDLLTYRKHKSRRQENFFKYMREEFLLDALVDYHIEPEDPTRTVPNPERRTLDKQIRAARRELSEIEWFSPTQMYRWTRIIWSAYCARSRWSKKLAVLLD